VKHLALLLAFAAGPQDNALTPKALEGTWKGARFTEGKGDDPDKGVKLEFTFKDGTLVGRKESKAPIGEATFTLSADGKQIDAVGTSGAYRGKTYLGVIKVEGDTMYWCSSGTAAGKEPKRPGGFTADPGNAFYLIVLRKQKP
jgi:uncharacterized protein (TIGR03067 family)